MALFAFQTDHLLAFNVIDFKFKLLHIDRFLVPIKGNFEITLLCKPANPGVSFRLFSINLFQLKC